MRTSLSLAAILCSLATAASAANLSYTGTFENDDDVQLVDFSVAALSTVTIRSYGYGGGVQSDGTVIAAGGFDPIVSVFDAGGALVGEQDDGPGPVAADSNFGAEFDFNVDFDLGPGSYIAAITQFDNFSDGPTLADGFFHEGEEDFTSDYGCDRGRFCDVDAIDRTADWAVDILNVESPLPAVPLPAGLPLLLAGLGGLALLRRTR